MSLSKETGSDQEKYTTPAEFVNIILRLLILEVFGGRLVGLMTRSRCLQYLGIYFDAPSGILAKAETLLLAEK